MAEDFCDAHHCPIIADICPIEWIDNHLAGSKVKDIIYPEVGNSVDLVFENGQVIPDCCPPYLYECGSQIFLDYDPDELLKELNGLHATAASYVAPTGGNSKYGFLELELSRDPVIDFDGPQYSPTCTLIDIERVLEWAEAEAMDRNCPD